MKKCQQGNGLGSDCTPVSSSCRHSPTSIFLTLARLEQLGIRQARYFDRVKTKLQMYLAATVANLTLLANQTGMVGDTGNYGHGLAAGGTAGGGHDVVCHLLPAWMLAWLR